MQIYATNNRQTGIKKRRKSLSYKGFRRSEYALSRKTWKLSYEVPLSGSLFLQQILIDPPEMEEGAQQAKDMKHRMDIPSAGAQAVKNGAHGIHDAAQDHEPDARRPGGFQQLRNADEDRPAADQMADDLGHLVFVHADGSQRDAQGREGGGKPEQRPAQRSAHSQQGGGHIGTQHQRVDVAVIQHPQDFFALQVAGQGMIDAGNGVQKDHGRAENGHAGYRQRAMGAKEHQDEGINGSRRAQAVGNGVEQLLPQRVIGNLDVQSVCRHCFPPFIVFIIIISNILYYVKSKINELFCLRRARIVYGSTSAVGEGVPRTSIVGLGVGGVVGVAVGSGVALASP